MTAVTHRSAPHDVVVIGGGVMGCTTALHLAEAGMRTAIVERDGLCMGASGVNAGNLTMHMILVALIPYALRGWELWRNAGAWLGHDVGFESKQGLSVAFSEDEAELLLTRAKGRIAQGAPFEIIDGARARAIEPGLTDRVTLAAHCRIDGFAVAHLIGRAFRAALARHGTEVHENTAVDAIERDDTGFVIRAGDVVLRARRIVLAAGAWMEKMLAWFGVTIPIHTRINQLVVTERMRPVMNTVIGVANGGLSLKQFANGTVLIGGGWQGIGDLEQGGVGFVPQNLIGNIRLARYCVPGIGEARVLRSWLGVESRTDDKLPLLGDIPGVDDAYVIGCVHSGFTSGPIAGRVLAQHILGQRPELPLFDPGRFATAPCAS